MSSGQEFDAVIVGAGISGMYQLHKLREIGLTAKVFETGTGVGGCKIRLRKCQLRLLFF